MTNHSSSPDLLRSQQSKAAASPSMPCLPQLGVHPCQVGDVCSFGKVVSDWQVCLYEWAWTCVLAGAEVPSCASVGSEPAFLYGALRSPCGP